MKNERAVDAAPNLGLLEVVQRVRPRVPIPLNDFGVSISCRMILESKEMSQKAEKVPGPKNIIKGGIMSWKR